MTDQNLVSLETAAATCGISLNALRKWLADPDVPVTRYKFGRSVRVDLSELLNYAKRAGAGA